MTLHIIALRKHGDVSKLDFEDGLRVAVQDRITTATSVHQIAIDLCAKDQAGLGSVHPSVDALLWVERDDGNVDLQQSQLLDVAAPVGTWEVDGQHFLEHHENWIGAATPGVRILYLMASLPAQPTLRELLDDATARMIDGALTCYTVTAGPADLAAIVAFWFPRQEALDDATQNAVFERIESATWTGERPERMLTFERIVRERVERVAPETFSDEE